MCLQQDSKGDWCARRKGENQIHWQSIAKIRYSWLFGDMQRNYIEGRGKRDNHNNVIGFAKFTQLLGRLPAS